MQLSIEILQNVASFSKKITIINSNLIPRLIPSILRHLAQINAH